MTAAYRYPVRNPLWEESELSSGEFLVFLSPFSISLLIVVVCETSGFLQRLPWLPIETRSDRDFSRRRDTGVPIPTEYATNQATASQDSLRSPYRQQDLSSPPSPDVDKDAQSRSKARARARALLESRMNRKELARGDYPAAYHRSRHRSLSLSRLSALGSAHARRRGRNESDESRGARGREEGLSEDPPTQAPTLPALDRNGICRTNLLPSSSVPEGGVSALGSRSRLSARRARNVRGRCNGLRNGPFRRATRQNII